MNKKREKEKRSIFEAYKDGKLSHKSAANLLRDLGFEQWEIDLYLDNDQTGPE